MVLDLKALESADRSQLIELIKELVEHVTTLEEQLRKSHRQAAPFSKGKTKAHRKKPGRKAGEGTFENRPQPEPEPGDQVEEIEVPLPGKDCPNCKAPLDVQTEVASTEDVPAKPVRQIKIFQVQVGYCPICGRKYRGQHPDLADGQHGATAHRLGPHVLGQALQLHYDLGQPLRKVPQTVATMTGIKLTQSAITQRAGALCSPVGSVQESYQSLRAQIPHEPRVNTDDTGWRTGGQPTFLMGFFTPLIAVYQIRDHHRQEEVLEVLGSQYAGALGTDRAKSYDAAVFDEVKQQKCLSHLLKNLSQVLERKKGDARCFAQELQETLRAALKLWQEHSQGKIPREAYDRRGQELDQQLTHQLRDRVLTDDDNQRLLDGIGMQHDRGRVLLFLKDPEVEPTNNRAERGLRSAVIARKVSHCSKNKKGESTYEAMKSVAATLRLRGMSVAKGFADLIRGLQVLSVDR